MSEKKLSPIGEWVVLDYDYKKDNDENEPILSDVASNKPSIGKVVAVGDECSRLKDGDVVVFDPFVPREVNVSGKKYFVIKEKQVYSKMN